MSANYQRIAQTAKRLIDLYGRPLKFYKLSDATSDPQKPWHGPSGGPVKTDEVNINGCFVIGNTSIPTESRGLAFDWVDKGLLAVTRHVVMTPAFGFPDLRNHKLMVDSEDSKEWKIIWGQCMQPGPTKLLYVFGLKE